MAQTSVYPGVLPKTSPEDYSSGKQSLENDGTLSPGQTIFVNNGVDMVEIKAIGFDMDYTLAQYISPQFETLGFDLAKKKITSFGYPKDFEAFEYDPCFAKRGLWFDQHLGNLLKVDIFGEILECFHGFSLLSRSEILRSYPQKLLKLDTNRVFVMHTMFNLPETCLLACIIDYYDNTAVEFMEDGWKIEGEIITFRKIFQDTRACIDHIHVGSMSLKKTAISNLPKYLKKDPKLPSLLQKIRASGKTVFLLTNSDWWYTSNIMHFLLQGSSWTSFFDYIIVDAGKPSFFVSGSPLQQVDTVTGRHCALDQPTFGKIVYSGGSEAAVSNLIGATSNSVLYVGDHLYADVVMARKLGSWRTLLIVPELPQELEVLEKPGSSSQNLQKLEDKLLTGKFKDKKRLKGELEQAEKTLNNNFGTSGSLFRGGKRLTRFGSRMMSWADIYTGSVINMIYYDIDHGFVASIPQLPHET